MFLPFAFAFIAIFIVLAIVLIIRKSKGKKELNKDIVSKERSSQGPHN
jgi:TRAP-type C4-dicarboxylate transport system permease small subunit